jgi:hypothetical protein
MHYLALIMGTLLCLFATSCKREGRQQTTLAITDESHQCVVLRLPRGQGYAAMLFRTQATNDSHGRSIPNFDIYYSKSGRFVAGHKPDEECDFIHGGVGFKGARIHTDVGPRVTLDMEDTETSLALCQTASLPDIDVSHLTFRSNGSSETNNASLTPSEKN